MVRTSTYSLLKEDPTGLSTKNTGLISTEANSNMFTVKLYNIEDLYSLCYSKLMDS